MTSYKRSMNEAQTADHVDAGKEYIPTLAERKSGRLFLTNGHIAARLVFFEDIMAPTAAIQTKTESNGKHHVTKNGLKSSVVPTVHQQPKVTSAEVINLEHEYGAHK